MPSLKQGAGYLLVDHRESPGLTPEDVAHVPDAIAVGKGEVLERDIKQCSHCQRGVVLEPNRVRSRGYCPKCDHYVCDQCEAIRAKTGDCVPMVKVIDRAFDNAIKLGN
jgi:hypothetical protein